MENEIHRLHRQVEDLKAENLRLHRREEETIYRSLFENNHAVMLLIDPETATIKDANPAACAYYGWSREQLQTLRIDEINTLTKEDVFAQMQIARAEKCRNFFFRHRRADGSIRDVEVYSGPLTVRGQTLLYSIVHDITDRVHAQKCLTESERRLSTLMENLPGMVYRCLNDEFWTMKFVSEGCFALTGFPSEDLLENHRTNYAALIHPDDRQMVWEQVQAGIDNRERFDMTYRIHCADGAEKWVMEIGQGIFSETGDLLAIEGFITDITERKRSEKTLRQSEEQFRLTFHTSPDSINLNRLSDGMYFDINQGFTKLTGYSRDEAIGKTSLQLNIWVDPEQRDRLIDGLRSKGYVENFEARFQRKNGQIGTGLMSARVLRLNQEDVILSITRDITMRKQVEDALRESEERHRKIVEFSTDAILVRSGEIIVYANPAAIKLFRARHGEDLIGRRYLELVHPDDRAESAERIRKGYDEKWIAPPREHRIMALDGQVVPVESTGVPVPYRGETQLFGVFRDITERKRAENELRRQKEILQKIFDHLPVMINFIGKDGRIELANREWERTLGWTLEELQKDNIDVFAECYPDPQYLQYVKEFISSSEAAIADFKIKVRDGHVIDTSWSAIHLSDGTTVAIGQDTSERKRADQQREKLETQLRQAQKMEAIGTLAGGIAHDFNNILSVIIGNAEILQMTDISFSGKNEVNQILTASKRAKDLVRQILAFSRQGEQQKLLMSLKPVVKETLEFLRASIPSTIQLAHYLKPDVGSIMADPTQMQQVLMNLCTNAAHAMEKEGGVLNIELDTMTISEEDEGIDPETEHAEYVRLTVSDTGHGIEPGLLPRIFDPYFSTKGPDKGTGLGLSVVHGIVKSHGGIVRVYSEVGKGTVFHVLFPRADGAVQKDETTQPQLPMGAERILVVDDEKHLVEMYQRMVGLLGYHADIRTSPIEAIEAVRSNPTKYDLILTDMTMPQMNGYQLAKKVMDIRPGMPVILCTGFSDQINEEKARMVGILAFLLKPVLFHDLANTLRNVLDASNKR